MNQVLALLLALVPLAACAPTDPTEREPFQLQDFVDSKFIARSFKGTWVADDELRFYNLTTREVIFYNVRTETNRTIVPSGVLSRYNDSSIDSYSKDGKLVAIAYETDKVYRHSTTSKFVIYDTTDNTFYPVHDDQQLRSLVWAGDRSILWVTKDNNIYYRQDAKVAGADVAITTDGVDGLIFNGVPDWVYEEEVLASGAAMWPSPDGKKLAFASFDDSHVNHTFYFKYDSQYPTVVNITYPKAGTPNPNVHLRVVDLESVAQTKKVTLVDIPAPEAVTKDHILYGCFWTEKRLLASWTNRVQNLNIISSCDTKTGTCTEALSQSERAGWVDPPALEMHSSGRRAAAILPNQDHNHLAVITFPEDDGQKASVTFLTSGNVTVLGVLGWDEDRDYLYYLQTELQEPGHRQVFRVSAPGGSSNRVVASAPECLTCKLPADPDKALLGKDCTYGGALFSKKFTYGVLSCLGPDPAYYALYSVQGTPAGKPALIRMWEDNADLRARLATRLRPDFYDDWVPVEGGFNARVRLYLPPGMDKSGATKYPLLVFVYAGPDSNQISTAFSVTFGDYLCTSRNIVYALIDGRGSGHNGRRQMHAVYRRLGTVEIQDQIAVAKHLKENLPYVDPARTAIWGWSYGGFSTAHAMAQDLGGVFCCGVSVAPVTSFIYYDTIYTERYMGLPTAEDNLGGYNGTDVTRNVANFAKKKYLLIHGNADDNVHYQQSMELSRALENAVIMFQQQSYPNEAHALAGVKRHVYHTMDDFWTRAFKLPTPEWQNRA
ncbi:venom dipeptidyl peptidase 4 [Frankliniella occidentalis]|uniref:Venom dipeptidyl peptidase 4 n=1 Tax=Frankliniella occidentalis TaxID=133901 RepID=A0A9C6TZG3_FRAOC|nr:venom dipeptidyl peptidase 4 [Frankliniella occidentalis]